jgi:predicted nucleic acid-binding protein
VSVSHQDNFLLDTSALFALLEDEPGADRVEIILQQEEVVITWTTLLEIFYISLRERGEAEANRRYAALRRLKATVIWELDEPTLLTAGDLKANYRISVADAIIAAYALQNEAVLVHKDPELSALDGQIRLEALPFKKR